MALDVPSPAPNQPAVQPLAIERVTEGATTDTLVSRFRACLLEKTDRKLCGTIEAAKITVVPIPVEYQEIIKTPIWFYMEYPDGSGFSYFDSEGKMVFDSTKVFASPKAILRTLPSNQMLFRKGADGKYEYLIKERKDKQGNVLPTNSMFPYGVHPQGSPVFNFAIMTDFFIFTLSPN